MTGTANQFLQSPGDVLSWGTDQQRYEYLATLPAPEYDRVRGFFGKAMKVRVSTLDREVDKIRKTETSAAPFLEDPPAWLEEVNGEEMLDALCAELERYVSMPAPSRDAVALWIAMTYLVPTLSIMPMLLITSASKRCGKSTLLILLHRLCCRALLASNISAAAMYRAIEKWHPTLLLDEADTWAKDNEALRGVINAGHSRETARILRCVGDDLEPVVFDAFTPRAIAGIGSMADTIEDRAIIILMKRRAPGETVATLRQDRLDLTHLGSLLVRWAADHIDAISNLDPPVPAELHDRAADNWRPLLAIADLAGGGWPQRARRAAIALSTRGDDEDEARVLLLADIRDVLAKVPDGRISSHDLVMALEGMEDRPWPEWKFGKPMSAVQLARLLKPFGIATRNIKQGGKVIKAYVTDAFDDTFERYLKSQTPAATTLPSLEIMGNDPFLGATEEVQVADQSATSAKPVAVPSGESSGKCAGSSGVADRGTEYEVAEL